MKEKAYHIRKIFFAIAIALIIFAMGGSDLAAGSVAEAKAGSAFSGSDGVLVAKKKAKKKKKKAKKKKARKKTTKKKTTKKKTTKKTTTKKAAAKPATKAAPAPAAPKYTEALLKDSEGYRYRKTDGTYLKTSWKTVSAKTYYFAADTYAVTGENTIGKNEYFFDDNSVMQTGWVTKDDGERNYYAASGVKAEGWQTIGGKRYYFGDDGVLRTNTRIQCSMIGDDGSVQREDHTYGDWEVTTPAGKYTKGTETRTCTVCGKKETKQHACEMSEWAVEKEPTCTEYGQEARSCKTCGYKETKNIAMKAHEYGDWRTTREPNCYQGGIDTRNCLSCGRAQTRSTSTKHELVRAAEKDRPATCMVSGYENVQVCTVCKQEFFNYKVPLGHDWNEECTEEEATCEKQGRRYIGCKRCGATKDMTTTPKLGHTWSSWEKKAEATCEEKGSEERHCETCGKVETKEIRALGHHFSGAYIVDKYPTCTEAGSQHRECSRCHKAESPVLIPKAANGHEWKITEVVKEATCEEQGTEKVICVHCNRTSTRTTPALGHQFDGEEIKEEAKNECVSARIYTKCSRKGCEKREYTGETPGKGHTWNSNDFATAVCTVCGTHAPNWTNEWYEKEYLPKLKEILAEKENRIEKYQERTDYDIAYNYLSEKGIEAFNEAFKDDHRVRIVWGISYEADTDKCEGFDGGKSNVIDTVITADHVFKKTAPAPRDGYVFDGWYDKSTGKKVEDSAVEGTTLKSTWKDESKTFEARYKDADQVAAIAAAGPDGAAVAAAPAGDSDKGSEAGAEVSEDRKSEAAGEAEEPKAEAKESTVTEEEPKTEKAEEAKDSAETGEEEDLLHVAEEETPMSNIGLESGSKTAVPTAILIILLGGTGLLYILKKKKG